MSRRFTGRHMAALMILFFGTIIAVNLTMATFAARSFGGTVVDNSYVASQQFNTWLRQAREQSALGWDSEVALDDRRHVVVSFNRDGAAATGAAVAAVARHPVGRVVDVELRFAALADGGYRSLRPLPPGRWLVHVEAVRGGARKRLVQSLS
jgi:nitrogen fixation protein FixH